MKYQHNDYVEAVRTYLVNYEEFRAYTYTLKEQIEEYERRLQEEGPVPKTQVYSKAPGAGNRNGSQQESYCLRREFLRSEIERMQREVNETEAVMSRLLLAIKRLSQSDRDLLTHRFIEKASWEKTAELVHASTGYCRKRCGRLYIKLAGIMFGPNATPPDRRLIFYKEPTETS